MKSFRTLTVIFDNELMPHEIPSFRGAIVDKVGIDQVLFHNHIGKDKFLYKYPLIQYKSINKKPAFFCIGDGVDEIHKLFIKKDWSILVNERQMTLKIDTMDLKSFRFNVWEKHLPYRIQSWMGLNPENFKLYLKIEKEAEKLKFLENILTGNILSMAKGIDWTIEKRIEVRITKIIHEKLTNYKKTKLKSFDIEFTSNVSFPAYLGLGKGVSIGYGTVKMKKLKTEQDEPAR